MAGVNTMGIYFTQDVSVGEEAVFNTTIWKSMFLQCGAPAYPRALLLKVWSMDQWYEHHLGTFWKCLLSEPITDLLNQKVWAVTFPVVQWLRLHASNAGGPDLIPGQGTKSRTPQRRSKIPSAATKT